MNGAREGPFDVSPCGPGPGSTGPPPGGYWPVPGVGVGVTFGGTGSASARHS